jgi:hypothetical protein
MTGFGFGTHAASVRRIDLSPVWTRVLVALAPNDTPATPSSEVRAARQAFHGPGAC